MRCLAAVCAVAALLACSAAVAQDEGDTPRAPEARQGEAWYYDSGYEKPTPLMIIQQKAQARAAARIRRIETMAAYGMSNSRPTANAAPMTGMYSPAWQMPGGRPFGWFTNRRPQYLIWR
ncbi:MAG: hypothetical protein AAF589_06115 [Planctomycetota bacterium]